MKIACDVCEKVISTDNIEYINWALIDIKDSNEYGKDLHYRICGKCADRFVNYLDKTKIVSA